MNADTGDVELLVYKSEGVHVELAGSLQNEECSSSIDDNKVPIGLLLLLFFIIA